MLWLEHKYINLLSGRLERFSRVNDKTYRCRCPICGDSQKDKRKTRGYFFVREGVMRYWCHNCGASMKLPYFIKTIDPNLYLEFVKEKMRESGQERPEVIDFAEKMKPPVFVKTTALKDLKKISQLDPSHPAKQYVDKRLIPSSYHYKLFYAPKFVSWVNSIIPNKFKEGVPEEPRLIIPFLDKDKQLFGFQGRSFAKDGIRYITIILDESKPKMFGLDTVDTSKDIYLVEGPIDSMFIPNAVAVSGSDLMSQLRLTDFPKENIVLVFDNEPRNKEIVKKIEKAIEAGYRVCIWPLGLQHKDINDMVMAGYTPQQVKTMIDECIYAGLEAKLYFAIWRKDK